MSKISNTVFKIHLVPLLILICQLSINGQMKEAYRYSINFNLFNGYYEDSLEFVEKMNAKQDVMPKFSDFMLYDDLLAMHHFLPNNKLHNIQIFSISNKKYIEFYPSGKYYQVEMKDKDSISISLQQDKEKWTYFVKEEGAFSFLITLKKRLDKDEFVINSQLDDFPECTLMIEYGILPEKIELSPFMSFTKLKVLKTEVCLNEGDYFELIKTIHLKKVRKRFFKKLSKVNPSLSSHF
ncbi:MAG: hypothetical protein AAF487_07165 [Bacteroidota bacterium]